jgi:hypothetical protein
MTDNHHADSEDGRTRLRWLADTAEQIAVEAGLQLTADIVDLGTIAYVGLLDTPTENDLTRNRLLQRCRHNLIIWAWEQGNHDLPLLRRATQDGIRSTTQNQQIPGSDRSTPGSSFTATPKRRVQSEAE